ncbi:DUF2061 domain-containing protein [Azospirillum sp. sgz301742]
MALAFTAWTALTPSRALALNVGDTVSGQFELGAKQVPLPSGNWIVAGLGTQSFSMPEVGAFGAIRSAVLLLTRDNRVQAVLEVNANALPSSDGWGRTRACAPEDGQLMLITRYRTGWETSCQFLRPTHFGPEARGPEAWEKARAFITKTKLTMPEIWLTAGFRVSDRQDLIDARYHISPALLLGPAALQLAQLRDWSGEAAKSDPLRQGAVQAVAAWASGFDAWIERGLRNRIADSPGPLPELAAPTPSYVDLKVTELNRLLRDGQIDKATYDAQVERAKTEVPEYKPSTSLVSTSVRKNISFRSIGTIVDYGIAYLVTANSYISWGIALTLNATDSVWFVLNDQYWDDHYAKLNTHNAERLVDFTYIGEHVGAEARL